MQTARTPSVSKDSRYYVDGTRLSSTMISIMTTCEMTIVSGTVSTVCPARYASVGNASCSSVQLEMVSCAVHMLRRPRVLMHIHQSILANSFNPAVSVVVAPVASLNTQPTRRRIQSIFSRYIYRQQEARKPSPVGWYGSK